MTDTTRHGHVDMSFFKKPRHGGIGRAFNVPINVCFLISQNCNLTNKSRKTQRGKSKGRPQRGEKAILLALYKNPSYH